MIWATVIEQQRPVRLNCFIMKPDEARRLAHRGEKEGRVSYGLQPNQYDTDLNEPERHCEKEGERERAHNKMHDQPPIIPSQQRCR